MRDIAQRFASHPAVKGFVLPTPSAMKARVAAEVASWPTPVRVVATDEEKLEAFGAAVAAVAVTGTVTLELALAGVPMVTTYIGDRGQRQRYLKYKVRHVSLPNAILDRPLVPEVLGLGPEVDQLARELDALLAHGAGDQLTGFREVRALMENGAPEAPRWILPTACSRTPER